MEVKQIATIMNDVTSEILGESAIQTEDLSNIVDVGTAIFNANAVDAYVKSLLNHIGKMVFVDRKYSGGAPSLLMDGWEFGSVLEKVSSTELPAAEENEDWELVDGQSYDPNIFYQPKVKAKFFNKKVTFMVPRSFTDIQLKQSFDNAQQMNAFLSMLYNDVDKALTVKMDALIMRTINNMIGETIYSDYQGAALGTKSGIKAVNVLYLYNQTHTPITYAQSKDNPEFIKYVAYIMSLYESRLSRISKLFNIGGADRFTPKDRAHWVLLNDFAAAADVYLQSDTFHDEYTRLPQADKVPYWQAPGTTFDYDDVSKIDITTAGGDSVSTSGILGVLFDRDSMGVSNLERRVDTSFNAKSSFFTNYYKFTCGYFNDEDENFVVFFASEAT